MEQGRYIFSCMNEQDLINCGADLFVHFNIHQLCNFTAAVPQCYSFCWLACGHFCLCGSVVGVIEGVGILLRRWVYCDPTIFIRVSGNYAEKVGLHPQRKR